MLDIETLKGYLKMTWVKKKWQVMLDIESLKGYLKMTWVKNDKSC